MAANEPTGGLKEEVRACRKRWRNLTHPTDKRRREQHSSSEEFKGRSFQIHFQSVERKRDISQNIRCFQFPYEFNQTTF